MRSYQRRLLTVLAALAITLGIGTAGFVIIEHYPVFDAFYMSLITITTVGYEEIHQLSRAGRIFNSVLLVFGVGVVLYAFGAIAETLFEAQLRDFFYRRKVKRMIDKLKDHYIVCGFGRVGRGAARELRRSGVPFVIVDPNAAAVDRAVKKGMLAVAADAKNDEALREVGIERAKGLIGALPTDADNLFLILSAKALNPKLRVASRVNEEESESKLKRAGADAIFRPYDIAGYRLAQAILRPYVADFLEVTASTVNMGLGIALEQVHVRKQSPFCSKSLKDLQLPRDLGVIVLAIRRANGEMQFNPPADAVVECGDHLVVMGHVEQLHRLAKSMEEWQ